MVTNNNSINTINNLALNDATDSEYWQQPDVVNDSLEVVWIISDGKPGHLNQSRGLTDALLRLRPNWKVEEIPAMSSVDAALTAFSSNHARSIQKPALVLAAGHRTHTTALALSRKTGAKSIVIMKPSLPISLFDLGLIPEHDRPKNRSKIVVTKGALNRMRPSNKIPDSGMVMVGGPSKHYGWDNSDIINQIKTLITESSRFWTITTSRRTPAEMLPSLKALESDRVEFIPSGQTDSSWIGKHLPCSEVCWVTPDSVSMVYEALTAGCQVGTFTLPNPADSRVVRGLQSLIDEKRIVSHKDFANTVTSVAPLPLDEANRCARELLTRFML
jgi:mitochondrial fission protein ELM1